MVNVTVTFFLFVRKLPNLMSYVMQTYIRSVTLCTEDAVAFISGNYFILSEGKSFVKNDNACNKERSFFKRTSVVLIMCLTFVLPINKPDQR